MTNDELTTAGIYISYRVTENKWIVWGINTYRKFDSNNDAVDYAYDRASEILSTSDFWMEDMTNA